MSADYWSETLAAARQAVALERARERAEMVPARVICRPAAGATVTELECWYRARVEALVAMVELCGEAAELLRASGQPGAAAGVELRRAQILTGLPWNQPREGGR